MTQVQATDQAFAAILADGHVVTWGSPDHGGDSSEVQCQLQHVRQIQANSSAFAAILEEGRVVTWGGPKYGGDSSLVQEQLRNVQQVQATASAFAAILAGGTVVTWGWAGYGGDSSEVKHLLHDVVHVHATGGAFAAITCSGEVVTWGAHRGGGCSEEVQSQLRNVQQIQATRSHLGTGGAFAAALADGRIVTWGHPECGGDSSSIQDQIHRLWDFVDFCSSRLVWKSEALPWGDTCLPNQKQSLIVPSLWEVLTAVRWVLAVFLIVVIFSSKCWVPQSFGVETMTAKNSNQTTKNVTITSNLWCNKAASESCWEHALLNTKIRSTDEHRPSRPSRAWHTNEAENRLQRVWPRHGLPAFDTATVQR